MKFIFALWLLIFTVYVTLIWRRDGYEKPLGVVVVLLWIATAAARA